MAIISNIANYEKMRSIQLGTLKILRDSLEKSFGPRGSNTTILRSDGAVFYTKDGNTILKAIMFQDAIESSVKSTLENITAEVVLKVGDGTTSAVILSEIIFRLLNEKILGRYIPYNINFELAALSKAMEEKIRTRSNTLTAEDAYNISLISTNGNVEVSEIIRNIYAKHGNNVYIDVHRSINEYTMIKELDGLSIDKGLSESCYVNDSDKNVAALVNPYIFVFKDPVDTKEMAAYFIKIMNEALGIGGSRPKPTIIICPKISRDMDNIMIQYAESLAQMPVGTRPQFAIVPNASYDGKLGDICMLTGAVPIMKYIDTELQKQAIEEGTAPTIDTLFDFAGTAEYVEAGFGYTKFINPVHMHNEDHTLSDKYLQMVQTLEKEYESLKINDVPNITILADYKRRIESLKATIVEYYIGGISMEDRDSLRDLVEDAVLNCRSAAKNGYGAASNIEGLIAINAINNELKAKDKEITKEIVGIILTAYKELLTSLYTNSGFSDEEVSNMVETVITSGVPFNIVSGNTDKNVVSSIDSDIYIFNAITKLVSLIVTSNQFLCPGVEYNLYI